MGNEQPAMTTDGRRHFSLFKQVGQLVSASEAEAELAFMHRLMALCSLPRTDPGDAKEFTRVNGPLWQSKIVLSEKFFSEPCGLCKKAQNPQSEPEEDPFYGENRGKSESDREGPRGRDERRKAGRKAPGGPSRRFEPRTRA